MSDLPNDLTSVGAHEGNSPPTNTSQTVRCPQGPDPSSEAAQPSSALYQLLRPASAGQLQIRVHPPRAQIAAPADDTEEIGQYRTVEALRTALAEASVEEWTGVFEDAEAGRVITDAVTSDHPWIGQPRYETVTLFAEADAATAYAESTAVPQ